MNTVGGVPETELRRKGVTTEDPRLDLIDEIDDRNLDYPIDELLTTTIELESRDWIVGVSLDQGTEGACVGAAITHELASEPHAWADRFLRHAGSPEQVMEVFAREFYWAAQRVDPWPGGEYKGARPRMSGTSLLAGARVMRNMGWWGEYRWAFGLDDTLRTLSQFGPVIYGGAWFEGMMNPAGGEITASGRRVGGHAVLLSGIDVDERTVTIHNSWGPTWGGGGQAVLPWDDLERLLKRAQVLVPVDQHPA